MATSRGLILLLCVASIAVTMAAPGPRAPMSPGVDEDIKPSELRDYLERTTPFGLASRVARRYKDKIIEVIDRLSHDVTSGIGPIKDKMLSLLQVLTEEREECARCKAFVAPLKEMSDTGVPLDEFLDPLLAFCEMYAPFIDTDPIICNAGVIQGPYVWDVLNRASTIDFCESLNSCFPPKTCDAPDVKSRLPWKREKQSAPDVKSRLPWKREKQSATSGRKGARKEFDRNDVIAVAQLTDIHTQPKYAIGSPTDCGLPACCREDYTFFTEGSARAWGEYSCNIPERTIHLFLQKVAELQPDFIIYSGDTPPHTVWDETMTSQLNCTSILVNAFIDNLGSYQVYPAIGNHELYPTNIYHPDLNDTVVFNDIFTGLWSPLARFGPDQEETMRYMGYYSMEHTPGLRVLGINTIIDWYNMNFYAAVNKDAEHNRLYKQFLEDTLSSARENGEKVIIIGHNPAGKSSTIVRASRWWEELVVEYGDVITLQVAGHTHDDHYNLFMDPVTGDARHVIHVAPSSNTRSKNNPSMRIYYLDKTTFELLDYDNYYLDIDLTTEDPNNVTEIQFGYRASELYSLPDMSPTSWQNLTIRFVDEDDLFQEWYDNYNSQARDEDCDTKCKGDHLCAMWFPNYDDLLECESLVNPAGLREE